jgi:succinoglycan biosynthesis transport protein ExoP
MHSPPRTPTLAQHSPTHAQWLEPPEEELGLKRYLETIRERWRLVLAVTLITTGIAVAYVLMTNKTYESQADLLVTPVSTDTLPSLPLLRESADATRDVETAARLATNREVASRVRDDTKSKDSVNALLDRVSAEPVAQSDIVTITAEGSSPEAARDLADAFATAAVDVRTDRLHSAIGSQIAAIQAQLSQGGAPELSSQLSQLQALSGAPDPTIRVESSADLPTDPAKPRPVLTVAGGLFAGLILGVIGAFAAQILDPRLRREDQLRRRYRLPILTRVPEESGRHSGPLSPRELSAPSGEAYRTLRTMLDARRTGPEGRAILVTGASPSEGKTTTALNLAALLALAGKRVILVDADLRRPALGRAVGIRGAPNGVVSVLIESVSLETALMRSPSYGPNLQLLLADSSGGWIAELFSLPAAQRLIDDARRLADYVIVDSPPLTDVVDALPLARRCDDVLIVTRLGTTRLDRLSRLAELLADNEIAPVGFAVIGVPRPRRSSYRYYMEPSEPAPEAAKGEPFMGAKQKA